MRALTALVLSLILAVASVSMAVARGQAPMGQTIALCTDAGAVTVALDANGDPVPTSPHLCPDCLSASTAFDLSEPVRLSAPPLGARALDRPSHAVILAGKPCVATQARGPPSLSV